MTSRLQCGLAHFPYLLTHDLIGDSNWLQAFRTPNISCQVFSSVHHDKVNYSHISSLKSMVKNGFKYYLSDGSYEIRKISNLANFILSFSKKIPVRY